ncbi:hypothetical protein [Rhodococcus sp. WAY2]|uniref:hypothetical protein n=1 Tax=Rhodococcus sp. WAY2 TaxID=2663121 RepID=UPI00135759D7|nr:hypothetical protein [Rhodococcus sp. WAY2]
MPILYVTIDSLEAEALGKMTVEKDVALTDTLLDALASAADVHEVNLAIKAAFADHEDAADDEGAGVF